MALGILRNGVPLDSIFSPKGTSTAAATGLKQNGVDLNQYLLALADGSAISAVGLQKNGADFNTIFGAGTPSIGLPNGVTISSGRTGASATITFKNDGTWAITTTGAGVTYDPSGASTTGTWLTSGSVSQYTVTMVGTGFTNGADPGGGSDSFSTTCATQKPLTSNQSCTASAVAGTTGSTADNAGFWVISLYQSGVLVKKSTFQMNLTSSG